MTSHPHTVCEIVFIGLSTKSKIDSKNNNYQIDFVVQPQNQWLVLKKYIYQIDFVGWNKNRVEL